MVITVRSMVAGWIAVVGALAGNGCGGRTSLDVPDAHVQVSPQPSVLAVAATSACMLRSGQGVVCWGTLPRGVEQLLPAPVSPLDGTALHAGWQHYCFVGRDLRVRCFGENWHGELGTPSRGTGAAGSSEPVLVQDDLVVKDLATGEFHSCAATDLGEVICWGKNDQGQTGQAPSDETIPMVVDLPEGSHGVGAGTSHSCAVGVSGAIWCWGSDTAGQLGDGEGEGEGVVRANLDVPAASVRGGLASTCSLSESGLVHCWGDNAHGQLGRRGLERSGSPLLVPGLPAIRTIAMGLITACAVSISDELWCWGMRVNADEDDRYLPRFNPERISAAGAVQDVSLGKLSTICVERLDRTVWCWGGSGGSELGDGRPERRSEPVLVRLPE